jgi:hypothetical protein
MRRPSPIISVMRPADPRAQPSPRRHPRAHPARQGQNRRISQRITPEIIQPHPPPHQRRGQREGDRELGINRRFRRGLAYGRLGQHRLHLIGRDLDGGDLLHRHARAQGQRHLDKGMRAAA